MPAIELSPLQAQFMPDISSLWCVNRISTYTEQTPVVILLFMSWSISCREALIQILNLQRSQPGVYYLCISKEHSSAIRSEMQSAPELLLLNVFTDPKHVLKPFLIANTITTVPTAILFASNKRMIWHGHALSPEFTEKFTKLIRQSHIKVYNEDALLFKTLRSSSCRSISARRSPTGNGSTSLMASLLTNKVSSGDIPEESSTLQEGYTKAHSPLVRSTRIHRSKQRPSSVQRASQIIHSATHDMLAVSLRENDLAVSSLTDKQLPQSSYPIERVLATSALWKTLSPPRTYAQRAPTSDNAKKYLIRSPRKERTDPLQPLRSPTSIIRAELSEATGEESSYPLVEEAPPRQSLSKPRILHRSSVVAENVKKELGWMLMKQDSILPKPLRIPESFPVDVLRDSEGTQQLFNKSAVFLRRMNV
ncbi:Hypothetical protein DHA2_151097 [Giardia duodenalis]|uniref:Thioredoxin domain-containing protein n=1 Tax=Giardia intestinalis TaxID=5741 RepID=V6TMC3_GIAIN|nr:Hypothetical protein DHA2_151097 [Giardia intestinalis]